MDDNTNTDPMMTGGQPQQDVAGPAAANCKCCKCCTCTDGCECKDEQGATQPQMPPQQQPPEPAMEQPTQQPTQQPPQTPQSTA